jgi:hypothetical protein
MDNTNQVEEISSNIAKPFDPKSNQTNDVGTHSSLAQK